MKKIKNNLDNNDAECIEKNLLKSKKSNSIKKIFYAFLIQQIIWHLVLVFVYYNKRIPKYIYADNELEKNNFWIKILNLGYNKEWSNGTYGFPDFICLKFFILFYVGSFVWWYLITPYLIYKYLNVKEINIFIKSYLIILFISIIFYLVFPIECLKVFQITQRSENKSLISGLIDFLLFKTYDLDTLRFNNLPSMHVSTSWLCYIPFRNTKNNISKKIVWLQFIMAFGVFISTFVLKQHYIMDGITSIFLVEIVYFVILRKNKNKKI